LIASDLEDRIMLFLAVKKLDNLSKKTLYNYNLQLINFASFLHKPINSISPMDIRCYMAYRSKTLQPSSMVNLIDILKTFFGWCKSEEIILKDPMQNIKNTKVPQKLKEPLTLEELEIMRQSCVNKREKAILEVFYSTGVRVSELSDMNIKDVNWDVMTIKVLCGKGSKGRIVCFTSKCKIFLKQYLQSRTDDCEALFVTGKYPLHRLGIRSLERTIKKIALRSGIKKNIFCHLLRTTHASISIANGASIYSVQKLLGHESTNTTQRYIVCDDKYLRHEYDKHFIS
jgi:integrase/recombinase XerD